MILRAALLITALLAVPAWAATAVALRPEPVDADGVVTLGDLFEVSGPAAAVAIARGPREGFAVVLDAGHVQAAARAAGLAWANPTGLRRITVRVGTPAATVATAGQVEALVYARSLRAGEVIGADDVTWAPVAAAPAGAPEDAEAVIGLEARKPLRAGTAVTDRDLAAARVIRKEDAVSVRFRAGGVTLALKGTALNAAARGETVRIMNNQSKTVLEAVAAGPGVAVVGPEAEALKGARLASR